MSIAGVTGKPEKTLILENDKLSQEIEEKLTAALKHIELQDSFKALDNLLRNYLQADEEDIDTIIANFISIGNRLSSYQLETNDENSPVKAVIKTTESLLTFLKEKNSGQLDRKYNRLKDYLRLKNSCSIDVADHILSRHLNEVNIMDITLSDDGTMKIVDQGKFTLESKESDTTLISSNNVITQLQTMKQPTPAPATIVRLYSMPGKNNKPMSVTNSGMILDEASTAAFMNAVTNNDPKLLTFVLQKQKTIQTQQDGFHAVNYRSLLMAPKAKTLSAANDHNCVPSTSCTAQIQYNLR